MNTAVGTATATAKVRRPGSKAIWFFAAAAALIWLLALVHEAKTASTDGAVAPVSQTAAAQSAGIDSEVSYWVQVGQAGGSL